MGCWSEETLSSSREGMALGVRLLEVERDECLERVHFLPFTQSRALAHGLVLPTVRVGFPASQTILETLSQTYSEVCGQLDSKSVKSANKVNHYRL